MMTMAEIHSETDKPLPQSMELIERAKQEWEVTVDALPQLVFLLDYEGRILRANRTIEQWELGRVAEVKGTDLHSLLHPTCVDPACYLKKFWTESLPRLLQGEAASTEADDKLLDRYIMLEIRPTSGQTSWRNQISGSLGVLIIQDVTEEKSMQQRIQQQERLAAVGQMAAGIAHYFNNILTSIIGFAELLSMEPELSFSFKQDLKQIIDQGQRAAHLTRQILDFSRRSVLQRRVLDLRDFLQETVKFLERTAPENISIGLEVNSTESYRVEADPTQLHQALVNLAFNAWDAMPTGGVLTFGLSHLVLGPDDPLPLPQMSARNWVVLTVSDTGGGIPAGHRPYLFEPFFTTKEVGKGVGLGLAQVYGIVKKHGGEIAVASQINQGTTFTIYLPA